jgi:hypothetical protein
MSLFSSDKELCKLYRVFKLFIIMHFEKDCYISTKKVLKIIFMPLRLVINSKIFTGLPEER